MKLKVFVTLKPGVLDPQGRAIHHALGSLGFDGVHDVRRKVRITVPDHQRLDAGHRLQRDGDVAVAVGAGEDDDHSFHARSTR